MILSFQDDGSVCVFDTVEQANRKYEAIDVENGEFTFVDERGFLLRPKFGPPVKKKWLFFPVTDAGPFILERSEEKKDDLLARLQSGGVPVDRGPTRIRNLDDLKAAAPDLFTA